ncbi:sugar-binding transcriptional regulator [Paracoccus versutus]|uniref:sugar-binding transcriptional regulator n=1 Tax=Paracoccus versutus TaxID=34007 RepID=UPI001FB6ADBB|nr:sugar-binding transcriptional regulator [Paracoccus versutus]MCJ1901381.1 sugar-binding transcriptional regulator [Paracoccus versutus]
MSAASHLIAPQNEADMLRARAVWLYYGDGRTQSEIAKQLGINRIMVVRLLAEARRRNEVRITISSALSDLAQLELELEKRFGISRVILAPSSDPTGDPIPVIAAAAGAYLSNEIRSGMTIGVGWGRTLYASLPFISASALENLKIISLLGGIAAARRYNPAEFAWRFAELFQAEGYLIPAPAVVDSADTKHALLERCGLAAIFEMADKMDMALVSVGDIDSLTTSYRTGYLSEADRRSLVEAGAVGDVLYNFIDAQGRVLDHQVNKRIIATDVAQILKTPSRILISGGKEKVAAVRAAVHCLAPTVLITDEQTGLALMNRATGSGDDSKVSNQESGSIPKEGTD